MYFITDCSILVSRQKMHVITGFKPVGHEQQKPGRLQQKRVETDLLNHADTLPVLRTKPSPDCNIMFYS